MQAGRGDRERRIVETLGGVWGSSSQDFARLARELFEHSKEYATAIDGNCSAYALSGIPMLFSALRCLLIELNTGLLSNSARVPAVRLAKSPNDVVTILKYYPVNDSLADDLRLLLEVRNEIIHPSHRPTGTSDKTPQALKRLRELNLLQAGTPDGDCIWLSQLQSHRLFEWAYATVKEIVVVLLTAHDADFDCFAGIVSSYSVSTSPNP